MVRHTSQPPPFARGGTSATTTPQLASRERLANLRRSNLLTNGTQSDFFGETNSQYLTSSFLNFENESFVNTPRSSRSNYSFIDPIQKGAASHVLSQINPGESAAAAAVASRNNSLNTSGYNSVIQRYQSQDLNKENRDFNSNSSFMVSRSNNNFAYGKLGRN